MFQQIISRIFRVRHRWRSVSFDEIAELYVSRLLTIFAANIVSIFAVIYLYKLGYSVLFITVFYGIGYFCKIFFAIPAAQFAAYFGPKRGILLANILRIPTLIAFVFVPEYGMPAIVVFGVFQHMAIALYNISYTVSFSKVRTAGNTGKEIGTMQIIEKVAKVASPLVGGFIATVYGPEVTILIACGLFIGATLPLFRTVEPTKTKQKIRLVGFPWHLSWRTLASQTAVGYDFIASGLGWTLFMVIVVFSGLGQSIYVALGGLASLGVFISMLAAWLFGVIIDRNKGHLLLTFGTVLNSVVHLFRPFAGSTAGVVTANIANETAVSAYSMSLLRAVFDVADSSGFRITYLMFIEMALNVGLALGCGVLALALYFVEPSHALIVLFVTAAFYELLLLLSRRSAQ